MSQDGRPLTEVAIELDIESPTVLCYYEDYLKLANMQRLVSVYNELKDDLPIFDLHTFLKIQRSMIHLPADVLYMCHGLSISLLSP